MNGRNSRYTEKKEWERRQKIAILIWVRKKQSSASMGIPCENSKLYGGGFCSKVQESEYGDLKKQTKCRFRLERRGRGGGPQVHKEIRSGINNHKGDRGKFC